MRRIFASLVLLCTTFFLTPLTASAAPITVPTGLNPGDQYRLLFVTSTTRDATSNNIADYNNFVTTAANSESALAALGTTWAAIASTLSVSARDNSDTNPNISVGVPIFNLDNTLFAASNLGLWTTAASPISLPTNSSGEPALYTAWTGTTFDGVSASRPLGDEAPIYGRAEFPFNAGWFIVSQVGADSQNSFYAMSGVLTVTVPEPSSIFLTGIAVAGLAVASLLQGRHCKASTHVVRDHH
jgi:hypothetical protein